MRGVLYRYHLDKVHGYRMPHDMYGGSKLLLHVIMQAAIVLSAAC